MTINDFNNALAQFDAGAVAFNLGSNRAFLFGRKWYPLRAVINYAKVMAGEQEVTTDRALVEFAYLIPYVRISKVEFTAHLPVEVAEQEIIDEIRTLTDTLRRIVQ